MPECLSIANTWSSLTHYHRVSQFFISGDQNFSFSISTFNEQSGLISFKIDLFDLLAVQGTLKRILQHQSSKTLILWCSAFFMLQLSNPYTFIHDYWKAGLKLNTQKKKIMAPPSMGFSRQDYWSGLQRHCFANKGLSSQSYGFSNSMDVRVGL